MKVIRFELFLIPAMICAVGLAQDIESGLAAYYPMNGDELDMSPFGRDLVNFGAVPGPDRFGFEEGAMVFNGEEGTYMETDYVDGLPEEDFDRTLAAWVSVDTSTMKRAGVFIAYGTQEDYQHCHINTRPVDGGLFRFGLWGKNIDTHFKTMTPEWVHIVAVLSNSNQATIYVNGEVDTVDVIPDEEIPDTNLGAETLTLGAHNGNHPSKFSGSLDEVRIYNRALTAEDVAALYAFGTVVEKNPSSQTPLDFNLSQNYPNPFNPQTTITYSLPQKTPVRLSVYNLQGREVSVLVRDVQTAGDYTVIFDAADMASGLYIYQLQAGSQILTRKMMLMR